METSLDVVDTARGINEDGENVQKKAETYKIFPVQLPHNQTKMCWLPGGWRPGQVGFHNGIGDPKQTD